MRKNALNKSPTLDIDEIKLLLKDEEIEITKVQTLEVEDPISIFSKNNPSVDKAILFSMNSNNTLYSGLVKSHHDDKFYLIDDVNLINPNNTSTNVDIYKENRGELDLEIINSWNNNSELTTTDNIRSRALNRGISLENGVKGIKIKDKVYCNTDIVLSSGCSIIQSSDAQETVDNVSHKMDILNLIPNNALITVENYNRRIIFSDNETARRMIFSMYSYGMGNNWSPFHIDIDIESLTYGIFELGFISDYSIRYATDTMYPYIDTDITSYYIEIGGSTTKIINIINNVFNSTEIQTSITSGIISFISTQQGIINVKYNNVNIATFNTELTSYWFFVSTKNIYQRSSSSFNIIGEVINVTSALKVANIQAVTSNNPLTLKNYDGTASVSLQHTGHIDIKGDINLQNNNTFITTENNSGNIKLGFINDNYASSSLDISSIGNIDMNVKDYVRINQYGHIKTNETYSSISINEYLYFINPNIQYVNFTNSNRRLTIEPNHDISYVFSTTSIPITTPHTMIFKIHKIGGNYPIFRIRDNDNPSNGNIQWSGSLDFRDYYDGDEIGFYIASNNGAVNFIHKKKGYKNFDIVKTVTYYNLTKTIKYEFSIYQSGSGTDIEILSSTYNLNTSKELQITCDDLSDVKIKNYSGNGSITVKDNGNIDIMGPINASSSISCGSITSSSNITAPNIHQYYTHIVSNITDLRTATYTNNSTVFVKNGTYSDAAVTLIFPYAGSINTHIIGQDNRNTILGGAGYRSIYIEKSAGTISNITFENINFKNTIAIPGGNAGTINLEFINCRFTVELYKNNEAFVNANSSLSIVTARNCIFNNIIASTADNTELINTHNCHFINCTFYGQQFGTDGTTPLNKLSRITNLDSESDIDFSNCIFDRVGITNGANANKKMKISNSTFSNSIMYGNGSNTETIISGCIWKNSISFVASLGATYGALFRLSGADPNGEKITILNSTLEAYTGEYIFYNQNIAVSAGMEIKTIGCVFKDITKIINSISYLGNNSYIEYISGQGKSIFYGFKNLNATSNPDFKITDTDGWQDITCQLSARGSVNVPNFSAMSNINGIDLSSFYAFEFNDGALNELYATIHLNHDISSNAEIRFHTHYLVNTNSAGIVEWKYEYTYALPLQSGGIAQLFSSKSTLTTTRNIGATDANKHFIDETVDINLPKPIQPDTLIYLKISRDARVGNINDTYSGSCNLLCVDSHVQVNKFSTKSRVYPFYT